MDTIAHDTPEYQAMVALRLRVLREPLGLTYTPEQLADERDDTLLGAWEGEVMAGCLVLSRVDAHTVRMRQVAVAPKRQGQGIGRELVAWAEAWAARQGYAHMVLHARSTAVSFYLRLGYETVGDPFEEVTLPHVAMRKLIKSLTGA